MNLMNPTALTILSSFLAIKTEFKLNRLDNNKKIKIKIMKKYQIFSLIKIKYK